MSRKFGRVARSNHGSEQGRSLTALRRELSCRLCRHIPSKFAVKRRTSRQYGSEESLRRSAHPRGRGGRAPRTARARSRHAVRRARRPQKPRRILLPPVARGLAMPGSRPGQAVLDQGVLQTGSHNPTLKITLTRTVHNGLFTSVSALRARSVPVLSPRGYSRNTGTTLGSGDGVAESKTPDIRSSRRTPPFRTPLVFSGGLLGVSSRRI